ncbi:hypothetical protein AQ490_12930 [Wenjunlia vitaminophila]|uniref:Uncharacterized protein n=1 Tax=Wenjunlia vitaminophila TaxID=76728 RepID=A0A0T6LXV0_WENVI|nr:hypothetical protein [Wenjunlia vitaminophila]KRV50856.1 hypothetical protein AQ490_12930 [Wenjunlia vitaminophila]
MSLSYQTVRDADLKPFSEAVAKWRLLPGQFDTIADSFRNDVAKGLRDSDWEGDAADAAFAKLDTVQKQLKAASDEAKDIHQLLDSALQALSSAQRRLKDIAAEVTENGKLTLSADGVVSLDQARVPDEHAAALQKSYQDVVRGYNDGIRQALADATEADTALNWALTQDHNGRSRGFDADMYRSVAEAQRDRRQAARDVKTATEIAALGADATDKQLTQLNTILSRREGDPYFAERFTTALGPSGTLNFWRNVADKEHLGDDRRATLQQMQKSLGRTLATASHSDSKAMREWKKDVIALGDDLVMSEDTAAGRTSTTFGFQVMSSLLRNGQYDTDFLNDYGKALLAYEKDQGGPGVWTPTNERARLNLSGSDWGNDPMVGYMEALGRNSDAAQDLFHSKAWDNFDYEKPPAEQMDSDLKYLLTEREWPHDPVSGKEADRGYGYDELGHALEAATLGRPYDRPDLGLLRNATTANVMEQVISATYSDSELIDKRFGISNSFAHMGAGYIDDLDRSLSNFGDAKHGEEIRDKAFGHVNQKGEPTPGHITVTHENAQDFLRRIGGHEGAHEILSAAQFNYTLDRIKTYPDSNAEASLILETGAKVHGILDQARISDINDSYTEKSEEADRKLAEAAEWKKFCFSEGLGVTAGVVTLPFGGPTTSAGVAFAVPAVVDGITGALDTNFGIDVERQLKENEADFQQQEEDERKNFVSAGRRMAMAPLDAYISAANLRDDDPWIGTVDIEAYYNVGDNETDQIGKE